MSKTSQSQTQSIQASSVLVPTILKPLTSHDCEVLIARINTVNLANIKLRRDGDAQLIKLRRQLISLTTQITDIESQQSNLRSQILQNEVNIDTLSTWSHELREKDNEQNYISRCYTYLVECKLQKKGDDAILPYKCIPYDAFEFMDINGGEYVSIDNLVSTEIIRLASYVKGCELIIKNHEIENSSIPDISEHVRKFSTYGELFNSQSMSRDYDSPYLGQLRGSSAWTLVDLEFVTLDTTHILEYRKL